MNMGQLRTRKRGKTWEWSFEGAKINGKRNPISKGGYRTKAEAIEAGTQAKANYDNAGSVFTPSQISVSDYFSYWLENYVKIECKPNTYRAYSDIVRIHINPYFGKYPLKGLSPEQIRAHMNTLYANGLSRSYLKDILCVLSGALGYAVYPLKYIKENPTSGIKLPKCAAPKKETNRKIISNQEFLQILDYFKPGNPYRIIFMICYYTGLRIAECTGLTWDRIDLNTDTITIDRILVKHPEKYWYMGTPKTATSTRTISIGKSPHNELKQQKKWQLENRIKYGEYYLDYHINGKNKIYGLDNTVQYQTTDPFIQFVCTRENGTVLNPDLCRYASRIVNYKLGIQFNFHSLRHTHATMLIEHGANIKDVQTRLGHANISVTMDTYVHDTEAMKTQTVDIFEKVALPTAK